MNFVGALAYADDIGLLAQTPSAMRLLLQICDHYAAEYDINFNPDESKFLVIPAINGVICTVQCVTAPFLLATRRSLMMIVFLT